MRIEHSDIIVGSFKPISPEPTCYYASLAPSFALADQRESASPSSGCK